MIRRPPRSTQGVSSAASDVYKRQEGVTAKELASAAGFESPADALAAKAAAAVAAAAAAAATGDSSSFSEKDISTRVGLQIECAATLDLRASSYVPARLHSSVKVWLVQATRPKDARLERVFRFGNLCGSGSMSESAPVDLVDGGSGGEHEHLEKILLDTPAMFSDENAAPRVTCLTYDAFTRRCAEVIEEATVDSELLLEK